MPSAMTAAAKAYLATDGARVIPTLEIIRDLLNSDLRQVVDVTEYVSEFDQLGGDSTLRYLKWKRPGMTPTLTLPDDGYLTPGHENSLWAMWSAEPTDCYVRFKILVPLRSGGLETQRTYYGSIVDTESKVVGTLHSLALVTVTAVDERMTLRITKGSGDETVKLGDNW